MAMTPVRRLPGDAPGQARAQGQARARPQEQARAQERAQGQGFGAVVVTERCAGCGACLLTCPEHAIRPYGGTLTVREDLCTACGECVEICPVDAIEELC
jgi:electron transport complex protein RnfB